MRGPLERRTFDMEPTLDIPLGQWLTAAGVLSEAELARAEERQRDTGERLSDAIVRLGYATPEELAEALAKRLGVPYVGREEFPTSPPFLRNLSPHYMRQYRFCPLSVDNGIVVIAAADPMDPVPVD